MGDITPYMSEDRRTLRLMLTSDDGIMSSIDLDPESVSTVLHQLGALRAEMADPIPTKIDKPVFTDVTREANVFVGRQHAVSREVYIALRHAGFGWLAFTLERDFAKTVVKQLAGEILQAEGLGLATPPKPKIIL